jgi:hypothetical protein
MTLKTLINIAKYSGVWVGVVFNPYHWHPRFSLNCNDENYIMYLEINIGLAWLRVTLDDGRW